MFNVPRRAVMASMVVLLLVPGFTSTVLAGHGAFKGLWLSTDPGDGSTQLLIVAAGAEPSVVYEDFFAGYCFNNDVPSTHWVAAGKGEVEGSTLNVAFHKSGCGTFAMGGYDEVYAYDGATDTLIDSFGIVWSRVP